MDNSTISILIGSGGHAKSVLSALKASDIYIDYVYSTKDLKADFFDIPIIREINFLKERFTKIFFYFGVGNGKLRQELYVEIVKTLESADFPHLIHPTAFVSEFAKISEGAVILAGAVVGADAEIGIGALINTQASLDHDSKLGDFSTLAPGARTGGNVKIGSLSNVYMNAVVAPGIIIGNNCVLGANIFVKHNCMDGTKLISQAPILCKGGYSNV